MDSNLRREIILDNYQDPMNKGLIEDDSYIKVNTSSDSCIDNLDFMIKVVDEKIVDIRFDGEACAISTSASSIMIRSLIGKSIEEVREIIKNYKNMIQEEVYDTEMLGELNVYDEICRQPNRKNCALIPSKAIEKLLEVIDNGIKNTDK